MKNIVTLATFFPLLLGLILATLWLISPIDFKFEPALTALGLLATITGIFGERWASANERKTELLRALRNECNLNIGILSDPRFDPSSHSLGRAIIFPRLITSVTDNAISSSMFADRQHRRLFALLHQWQHTAKEFNRRLDITELRAFTQNSTPEIQLMYSALRQSKEFNDALELTQKIKVTLGENFSKNLDGDDFQQR